MSWQDKNRFKRKEKCVRCGKPAKTYRFGLPLCVRCFNKEKLKGEPK